MHQKHPGLPQRTHSKRHLKKEPTLESEPYCQQQQQHQPVFTVSLVESRTLQQIQKQWARVLHIKHIEYLPLSVVAPTVAGAWRGDGTCVILQNRSESWKYKIIGQGASEQRCTLQAAKKAFKWHHFASFFISVIRKRGAVTFPALITDRAGKPVTCSGKSISTADDDKPSCKHSQVRHGNPCDGVALCKDWTKNATKKTATKQFPHCHLRLESTVLVASPTIQSFC